MIVEMRTYTIQPGSTPEYFNVYETMGMEAQKEILGHMVGYYATEIGELNQVVHMWAYESFEHRAEARKQFQSIGWPPDSNVSPMKMENMIMLAAKFSPIQ